ncbi:MAG: triose-phosphate isomerase [Gammaproteobacteria bacterium]|nr:triose-phosphate isomerase [Gammaproteobacteria bacterium]MDE0366992.1 triose-phosphate isomerase [Gammaproteobacteria bacterium]
MRRPIVAGNWKMHGSMERVDRFCTALSRAPAGDGVEVLLFPPVGYLQGFAAGLKSTCVELGAQDLHVEPEGAYTGEVSGRMIRELGGRWALVGHSERRTGRGETDAQVARKCVAALNSGLNPIVCVGESLDERESGFAQEVVRRQLEAVLDAVGAAGLGGGAVAYEPVWAIGTGRTATPEQAEGMHRFIREAIVNVDKATGASVRILYGGSVKPDNAAELFAQPNIDGGLIGGASLEPESFLGIVAAVRNRRAADDERNRL